METNLIFSAEKNHVIFDGENSKKIYDYLHSLIVNHKPFIIYPMDKTAALITINDVPIITAENQFILFNGNKFIVHGEGNEYDVDYEIGEEIELDNFTSHTKLQKIGDGEQMFFEIHLDDVLPIRVGIDQQYLNWTYGRIQICDILQIKPITKTEVSKLLREAKSQIKQYYLNEYYAEIESLMC